MLATYEEAEIISNIFGLFARISKAISKRFNTIDWLYHLRHRIGPATTHTNARPRLVRHAASATPSRPAPHTAGSPGCFLIRRRCSERDPVRIAAEDDVRRLDLHRPSLYDCAGNGGKFMYWPCSLRPDASLSHCFFGRRLNKSSSTSSFNPSRHSMPMPWDAGNSNGAHEGRLNATPCTYTECILSVSYPVYLQYT
ncbi:hypothetical protein GWI33_007501 [Rhynchophorus ferrugineus]|uniref:Uncharacterized protein n=1 Tax=Rhynchophorus ferrugineus TaxID=354439 RepID=A0A834IED2_RHYFE|nr:hypothetical protein GWI33_007501 [Rhynchophorus ferrugineus]